jgi:hypothetical protein
MSIASPTAVWQRLCGPDELHERERAAFHFHVRDGTLGYSIR